MEEAARRVTVPCDLAQWGFTNVPVVLTRKFGYPGRIEAHERVWLTLAESVGTAAITLNGQLLGEAQAAPFESDVTSLLGPAISLKSGFGGKRWRSGHGGSGQRLSQGREGPPRRRKALRGRHCGRHLRATPGVVCPCGRAPCALIERSTPAQSFKETLDEDGQTARVELVNVSQVWYVVEIPIPV